MSVEADELPAAMPRLQGRRDGAVRKVGAEMGVGVGKDTRMGSSTEPGAGDFKLGDYITEGAPCNFKIGLIWNTLRYCVPSIRNSCRTGAPSSKIKSERLIAPQFAVRWGGNMQGGALEFLGGYSKPKGVQD
eukprot:379567-Hanusia_phi.AAC.1